MSLTNSITLPNYPEENKDERKALLLGTEKQFEAFAKQLIKHENNETKEAFKMAQLLQGDQYSLAIVKQVTEHKE